MAERMDCPCALFLGPLGPLEPALQVSKKVTLLKIQTILAYQQHLTVQYSTVWNSMVMYGMVWYCMEQYGTVWYSAVQYSALQALVDTLVK